MNNITFAAVSVIAIVTICYLVPLIRLKYFARSIEKSKNLGELSKGSVKLSRLCSDYDSTRSIEKDGEMKTLRHAEEFFSSSELARAKGINLKHINSAPSILSGLGVLGTFVGLTFSVATFDSTDSAAIMSSIKTLLGGMGTAFITSLIGMALSAVYTIFQKWFYNSYDNAISAFDNILDQKYYISADEVIIAENKKSNKEILSRLAAIERSKELNEKLNAIQEALTIHDEDGSSVTAGTMMLNLYEESEKQSQALESFTTDLSNELNASLGKTMDSSIVPLILKLEKSHDVMNTKIEELSNNIQSPATDFVTTAVGELRSSMQTMANEFRDSISRQTISQLETLANNLAKSGELLNTLPMTMQLMADKVSASFNDVKGIVSDLQSAILKQQNEMLENSRNANNTLAEQMRQNFSDVTMQQNNALKDAQSQLEQAVMQMTTQLAHTTAGFAEQQNALPQTLQIMTDKVASSFNEVNQVVGGIQASVAKQQSDMIESTKAVNEQLTNDFHHKFNEMVSLQQSVLAKMGEQMDATMRSVMTQLEKAVGGLNEQQTSLSNTHARSTREIERLLQGFAQSVANMHNANSESSEMLVSIKKAGDNLNESTDKLKSLATSLDSASMAVIDQQKEATAKFVEMQHENQSIISQLSTALFNAQKMVDSYVSDFETLKSGMKEVFKGINDGLKDYSATLRESTGSALAEYSEAMTKSTDGLKNIAAALEESAEELSDSIDKFKKLR